MQVPRVSAVLGVCVNLLQIGEFSFQDAVARVFRTDIRGFPC